MAPPESVGRYRLIAPLGRGAMGVVYRAHDPQLDREVAVKLISSTLAAGHGDPHETSSRFAREARVAARIHHPNVVAIYDAGELGDQLFLVMELVQGDTLGQRLARGQFPGTAEALDIVAQAADALSAAHQSGVIHRDMKPGNLLITPRGQVKVADFGIARAVGESTELTRTGMMVGSPAYMAPEQVQGRTLDGRADLFSLGVVLYEMLLRRKPFPADTLTTLVYQILHEDPFEAAAVAQALRPEIAEFLRWALAKDPAHRVPDAATFAARARSIAAALPGSATAPTAMLPIPPPAGALPSGAPLPPPSYATSAPTAIVERRTSPSLVRRLLPWAIAVLLAAGLVAALLMRTPAPPPDNSNRLAAEVPGQAQPLQVAAPLAQNAGKATEPAKPAEGAPPPATKEKAVTPKAAAIEPLATAPPAVHVEPVAPAPAPATPAETAPEPAVEPAAAISGTFDCRRGAEFHIDPEEALVTINGRPLGISDDWDGAGGGKAYIFPGPGEYTVKLSLDGYRTRWVRVRVVAGAKHDIVDVDADLDEIE